MNDEELKTVLQDAGLSPYQADAYVSLLSIGAAPATEIADVSGVPDPRIYDVLRDLESKGYIETYHRDSLFARAHDPEEVLQGLQSRSNRLQQAAEEIESRWKQPTLEDHEVNFVKRPETVVERAKTLAKRAEKQMQVCASVRQFEAIKPALAEAFERGVEIRLSIATDDEDAVPDEDELAGVCTEARHRKLPSPFLALVDRTWTCFAPHEKSVNTYGILVNDRSHAYVFNWYFITCLWEVWDAVYTSRSGGPPRTYVDLREFVRDMQPVLTAGGRVDLTLRGVELESNVETRISGELVDMEYTGRNEEIDRPLLAQLGGLVNITIDTGEEEVVVGGWGSVVEDIEVTLITVDEIVEPDGTPISEIP